MSFDNYLQKKIAGQINTTLQEFINLRKQQTKTSYYGQILEDQGNNTFTIKMDNGTIITARGSGSRQFSPGSGVFVVQGQIVS